MRKLSDSEYKEKGGFIQKPENRVEKAIPLIKERAHTFKEAQEILQGELSCLFEEPAIEKNVLLSKEPEDRPGLSKTALEGLLPLLEGLSEGASPEEVKEAIMPLADAEEAKGKGGRGGVLWPLRYALSGKERSPDPFTLIFILGKDESVVRVKKALAIL